MTFEISDLQDFMKSAENEFWSNNPKLREQFCVFIGYRVIQIKHGEIKEIEYIKKWLKKNPFSEGENHEVHLDPGRD